MRPDRWRPTPYIRLVAAVQIALLVTVLLAGCDSAGPAKSAVPSGAELKAAVDGFVESFDGVPQHRLSEDREHVRFNMVTNRPWCL